MTDPIDLPNFQSNRARPANEERIERIKLMSDKWREQQNAADYWRHHMDEEIREAKAAGHSYQQLADAAGVSIGFIQRACGK